MNKMSLGVVACVAALLFDAVADQMVVRLKDGREVRYNTHEVDKVYFERSREAAWKPVMNLLEPWWAAKTDPERNKFVPDPSGGSQQVLQVWGEHGWWAIYRMRLPKCRRVKVRGQFMFGGGDSGPSVSVVDQFMGPNCTGLPSFGFDDRTYPPKISGKPVEERKWYTFEYTVDLDEGRWTGAINGVRVAEGEVDKSLSLNWLTLGAGQPGFFKDVEYSTE